MPLHGRALRASLPLALLLVLSLPSPAAAFVPPARVPFATAVGHGDFASPPGCDDGHAFFALAIGEGVGNLRWVNDCPDVTGSANFALICQETCAFPPFCEGTPSYQRCVYEEPGTDYGMELILFRNGWFQFDALLPLQEVHASGRLEVLSWPRP